MRKSLLSGYVNSTILVIDDDPKIRQSLELAFPEYQFVGALCAEDGIQQLSQPHAFDLVFLDIKMTGMDGLQALTKIREVNPELGVLMLTGFSSKEAVLQALRGKADDFIEKPFCLEEVKQKIEKFLEARHKNQIRIGNSKSPIQKVVKLLEKNYQRSLTLEDASRVASLCPKYVSRKFKQETNKRFTEFKVHLRMTQAKKLLNDSFLNINQVAEKIGYENAESFMKMFKKAFGCTPTEYRLKNIDNTHQVSAKASK